jgi:hypothetical protein
MHRRLAAALAAALTAACAPESTPITKKGYQGTPPLGDPIVLTDFATLTVGGGASNWRWIPFPDTTCGNGSTTGLAVDWLAPADGGTDDLLVFFDGGGACWNYATCAAGTAVDRGFNAAKFQLEAEDYIPCSITNRALLPPSLAGATIVFIPYCTGDVHGGDNVVTYGFPPDEITWRHKGHANVMAFLKRLAATFPNPGRLVVAGSSAGGFGALVNYEAFRWYWPDADAFLVDDSGPALVNNDVPADFRQAWFANWRINVATDPFCAACRDDLSAAWTELASMHRRDRLAFLSHTQDGVMGPFMLDTDARFEEDVRQLEAEVLRTTANARAFYDAGGDHMLLTPVDACGAGSWVASHAAGAAAPVSLDVWLERMLSGDAAWATAMD